jgi:hypothetical protein
MEKITVTGTVATKCAISELEQESLDHLHSRKIYRQDPTPVMWTATSRYADTRGDQTPEADTLTVTE